MKRKFPVVRAARTGHERRLHFISPILPESVDLRSLDTPIRDQGEVGDCTGFAWAGLYDFVQKKKLGSGKKVSAPLFIYYCERVLDGTVREDAGSNMIDGGQVLAKTGFARETAWSIANNFKKRPSLRAYANAMFYKNNTATLLDTVVEMKQSLAEGFPFVLGIDVPSAMMDIGASGKMSDADWNTEIVGGHALLCVGYDDYGLIIRNSWSTSYGDKGYFRMPWNHVDAKAFDCYTIR